VSSSTATDVTALSSGALRKMRRKMGMIFQEYALVERLTVMENVLSGTSRLCRLLALLFPQVSAS
jgi:ABC-type phosphate/phosphonate transport system ATPase subunit